MVKLQHNSLESVQIYHLVYRPTSPARLIVELRVNRNRKWKNVKNHLLKSRKNSGQIRNKIETNSKQVREIFEKIRKNGTNCSKNSNQAKSLFYELNSLIVTNKIEHLPFVMIWFGSKDSSPSFSAMQAYNVRTLLQNYKQQINAWDIDVCGGIVKITTTTMK